VSVSRLKDLVVLVTGGAGLLGKEICRSIAANGGTPVVADLRIDAAGEVATIINNEFSNGEAEFCELDITSKSSIQAAIARVLSRKGRIDALVNCAYPRNARYGRQFENVEYEDFCENVNLHLGGYFLVTQQFALYFKSCGNGNIITFTSIYGVVPPRFEIYDGTGMTMPVEYAAIKSALIHLNRYMVKYFKGSGIRFNCLSPGGVADNQAKQFQASYAAFSQTKGLLSPADISGAAIFLLSKESEYVNGQNIIVDDGWSI
jgi:NAD(P)-dependent dehydrogenase (short-subunit alcohol dehydrogenase family)